MTKKLGRIFITLGIVFLLVSFGFFTFNSIEDNRAKDNSQRVVRQVIKNILDNSKDNEEIKQTASVSKTNTVSVEGNNYIGYISIPKLELCLPVMDDWNYQKLSIAPCRYNGSPLEKGFVIAAHNYSNHFGKISDLSDGDEVTYVDINNNTYNYTVKSIEVLKPNDVKEMLSTDWDLTLFTCNYYGDKRITVRLLSE